MLYTVHKSLVILGLHGLLLAASLLSSERKRLMSRNIRRDICVCDCKVYCGKTADWIRMPFWVVSGVGLGMGVLDFGGDR